MTSISKNGWQEAENEPREHAKAKHASQVNANL
jgi:hypothetical protein